ncbi:MFS transporter [Leucothrix pacifica]|uniref:Major facilitator superfamily (MFS) profile domain-containing protein n=1 Tax=Leucothrix pacifica TaxID=1247513 RepID=A0A317C974_9GAMM|nr:MFS transporter [Leucothrix pacifica]PWQ95106.1 hypothetical protein DKW60_15395 [Leucothrix pacifica]
MVSQQKALDERALKAVAVQFLINGTVVASYIPRLPEIRDSLNVDLGTIGQILTMASLFGLFGSWLSSKVVTRFGTKQTMIVGTIGLILTLPFIAYASAVWSLLLVLGLIMMLDPVVDVAMNIQGSNISARRHTPVMNRLHGLWSIGTVVGGLLASLMAAMLIPLHWHLIGASCLLSGALWYVGRGLLDSDEVEAAGAEQSEVKASRKAQVPTSLWLFAILGAVMLVPEVVGSDWAPFRAKDDLHTSAGVAGMAYVAFTGGMVFGRLTGDWLSAKLGKAMLLNYSVVTSTIGLSIACLIDVTPLVFIGLAIAGIGVSVLFPTLYDVAAQDPHRPGAALGALTAGSRGIMLIAPIAIGFLADTDALSVGGAMAIVALPCLFIGGILARKTHPA